MAPTPYKRLRRLVGERDNVTLVLVGECNTSQKCCRCHKPMENVMGEKISWDRGVYRSRIHAVKVCPTCLTTWNRDVNAARNIRTIFLALREGRDRPEAFLPRRNRNQAM
jgi:transposase